MPLFSRLFLHRSSFTSVLPLLLILLTPNSKVLPSASLTGETSAEKMEFFEKRVRPLLAKNCYSCHGATQQLSSLRVDSREAMLKGGDRGPALIPGNPDDSLLINSVRHQDLKMPLGGRLSNPEIDQLETWIRLGAPWPARLNTASDTDFYERVSREHWSFQPLEYVDPPDVALTDWPRNRIDDFVLASLEKAGLSPAIEANRKTLARRLSFSLLGLPPDPTTLTNFIQDSSIDAYVRLVDKLLDSPRFGEHWARHWMDVVRFAETYGYEWNYPVKGAWRYRDYLIRAFNKDVPYDQLIREHIAGDLLKNPRINLQEDINESTIGSAFLLMGEMGHDNCIQFREIRTDVVDNQIDTLTRSFQGLTVACARCHDHKLDPIPTEDYYALYGILNSSRPVTKTLDTGNSQAHLMRRLRELKPRIRSELAAAWLDQVQEIPTYLMAAHAPIGKRESVPNKDLDSLRLERWRRLLERESVDPESFLFPWAAVTCEIGFTLENFQELWAKSSSKYIHRIQSRQAYNREHYFPFPLANWHSEGLGLKEGRSPHGAFALASKGSSAITGIYPSGIYTHTLSARLNGALRSPHLPKDHKFLSLRVMGGILGGRRTVVDNCMLGEGIQVFDSDNLAWQEISTLQEEAQYSVYVELVTKSNNPRLPDRPKRIKGFSEKHMESPESYFGVTRALLHDVKDPPRQDLSHLLPLFQDPAPRTPQEAAKRYAFIGRQALESWSLGMAQENDVRWIHWLASNGLVDNSKELTLRLSRLISEYRTIESKIRQPRTINSLADMGPGQDYPLLQNGNAREPGNLVPRRYLTLLTEAQPVKTNGSGRQELATLIASAKNPLTARVMVNRIWYYLFGQGIVGTVNDFGNFGERPSHPQLLDYLAIQFTTDGWSIKKLIRRLVLSRAFQQSSLASKEALKTDPQNRLLHHYPLRRLEAEAIRDSILAASGRLNLNSYGPSVDPFREKPKEYRKLFSGPLDGYGRRSIYLKVTRMEGTRFLELFDFPIPSVSRGRRNVTNLPSQALVMLNNPFVIQQAAYWADRLLQNKSANLQDRLDEMFLTALARPPEPQEVTRFGDLARMLARLYRVQEERILESKRIWKDLAHSLLNTKEFIYLR